MKRPKLTENTIENICIALLNIVIETPKGPVPIKMGLRNFLKPWVLAQIPAHVGGTKEVNEQSV